ncbi:cyclin-G2-like isoform X2 [Liolophura sinensis]|uniref:cyclin-G2-like isoform X2 n=1 Tax=Liolophura sinensis TaxID=3198878 RepID=UPI003158AF00
MVNNQNIRDHGHEESWTSDQCRMEMLEQLQRHIPVNHWEKLSSLVKKVAEDLKHRSNVQHVENYRELSNPDKAYRRKLREIAVFNLRCLKAFFSCGSEVLISATYMLDCFLSKVRVQTKYMSCLTAACFGIASDVHASGSTSPSPEEFSRLHRRAWSPSDFIRMENKVMEKLNCNLSPPVTSLTFLQSYYEMICLVDRQVFTQGLWQSLTSKLEACLSSSQFNLFRPCTLALSVLDVVLQDFCDTINAAEVVRVVFILQAFCQISDAELYECNEAVVSMQNKYQSQKLYVRSSLRKRIRPLIPRPCLPAIPEEVTIQSYAAAVRLGLS